ncbi:MAG: serine acetyltransferase [Desulfobacterales bacterium]|jgi:serine O-acetyltransferase
MKENKFSDKQPNLCEVLPSVVHRILTSCNTEKCFQRLDSSPIPSRDAVAHIIHKARHILFPGYFTQFVLASSNLKYCLKEEMTALYKVVSKQIVFAAQHDCLRYDQPCAACEESSRTKALEFIQALPRLREILATDTLAAMDGDPAAKSYDEVITSYPGLFAITVQRIAHKLYRMKVPGLPRAMTEYAHSFTGIDIHPGARIGKSFFIDHGTGVVIGETTEIGNRVRLYQGVTLGALSMPKAAVESFRNKKRHPTIEDDVIIYSNTTVLGGETVIGARSTIGGNVWITESVPPDTKVYLKRPELIYSENGDKPNAKEQKKIITRRSAARINRVGC